MADRRPKTSPRDDLESVLRALEASGVLLVHDAALPSVSTLVAGAPIRGSWWGHAAGKRIFAALEALEDRGVAVLPLVGGKQTLVAPRLFGALAGALGSGGPGTEPRAAGLSPAARALLRQVETAGEVRAPEDRAAQKVLAERLLVAARQEHGERGAHETVLESWAHFARRTGTAPSSAEAGRAALEAAVASFSAGSSLLPWQSAPRAARAPGRSTTARSIPTARSAKSTTTAPRAKAARKTTR